MSMSQSGSLKEGDFSEIWLFLKEAVLFLRGAAALSN